MAPAGRGTLASAASKENGAGSLAMYSIISLGCSEYLCKLTGTSGGYYSRSAVIFTSSLLPRAEYYGSDVTATHAHLMLAESTSRAACLRGAGAAGARLCGAGADGGAPAPDWPWSAWSMLACSREFNAEEEGSSRSIARGNICSSCWSASRCCSCSCCCCLCWSI